MFSFSSSPFSVTMERIEKCAVASYSDIDEQDYFLNEIQEEISCCDEPDFENIRKNLKFNADLLCSYMRKDRADGFRRETLMIEEARYSRLCLELLKLKNSPLSAEELALTFLIIDFYRLAADRFSQGDLEALGNSEISFDDAIEFICGLNMPGALKEVIANNVAFTTTSTGFQKTNVPQVVFQATWERWKNIFLSHLNDSASVWQLKAEKPCSICLTELSEMHDFLKTLFANVAAPAACEYVPAVLEPPYTLDSLLGNLLPWECRFHSADAEKEYINAHYVDDNGLRTVFAHYLKRLASVKRSESHKAIKISMILHGFANFDNDDVHSDERTGKLIEHAYREEYEQKFPWCKPYFLWRDALIAGKDQNGCILSETLKISRNCAKDYKRLETEWLDLRKDIEKIPEDLDVSLMELPHYFSEKEQAFKSFLVEKCGNWELFAILKDGDAQWVIDELKSVDYYIHLLADGMPDVDASIEQIGDYLQTHVSAYSDISPYHWRCIRSRKLSYADTRECIVDNHLSSLFVRMQDKMTNLVNDGSIPVYLRDHLLDRFVSLINAIASNSCYKSQFEEILKGFRKKYGIKETGSCFSADIQKIKEMCDAEESKHRAELAEAAEAERRKVLFEMSHSIKNLLASVSEPLSTLLDELSGKQRKTIENALSGAGLIRDLAVGVHMSMRGEPGTWRKDVLEPGFGATTLDKIILDALRHAVSNMFDGKYFAQFVRNYFGRDLDTFIRAEEEWKAAVSAEDTFDCINKYFFDFKIDCSGSQLNIPIGDRDGTATKLLILFQELFLNAVKYSSFTEREKRFVKLDVSITPETWDIVLSNSAMERSGSKSSGIGLSVIRNFAELFEAKYDVGFEKETYITNMCFFLNK